MGRLSSFLARFQGQRTSDQNGAPPPAQAPAQAEPALPQRLPMPTRGQLRRERRQLVQEREEQIRDLGGLMLEMYRRNQFRRDLLSERCDELVSLESRLREVETLLVAAAGPTGLSAYGRCVCGAPLFWGSHFCANCGRAVGATPVVTCARCGGPLAADARFCSTCGSVVEAPPDAGAQSSVQR
jgi:Double zinc ribbon